MKHLGVKHLTEEKIALLAGGERRVWNAPLEVLHLGVCGTCRRQVSEYQALRQAVGRNVEAFALPKGFAWAELEAEMLGNIKLGVEVESITPSRPPETQAVLSWRGMVAVGALSVVVMTGWFLTGPGTKPYLRLAGWSIAEVEAGDTKLTANPNAMGLERGGNGMFFRTSMPSTARLEVGLEGSLRTASMDADSGQITVTTVSVSEVDDAQ